VRREPLRLGRGLWIGRHEIDKIDVVRQTRPHDPDVSVVAVTPRGALTLAGFDAANHGADEVAACIADVVREALDEIPAT
jgi:hypothetical protein